MRLSIKTKQVAGVVLLVGFAVTILSGVYTALIAQVHLSETLSRGEMLKQFIFERALRVITSREARVRHAPERSRPPLPARVEHGLFEARHLCRHRRSAQRRHRPQLLGARGPDARTAAVARVAAAGESLAADRGDLLRRYLRGHREVCCCARKGRQRAVRRHPHRDLDHADLAGRARGATEGGYHRA